MPPVPKVALYSTSIKQIGTADLTAYISGHARQFYTSGKMLVVYLRPESAEVCAPQSALDMWTVLISVIAVKCYCGLFQMSHIGTLYKSN